MRTISRGWIWATLPFLAALAWGVGAGCENTAGDCELTAECTGAPGSTASCDPSKVTGAVADTCGAFASATAKPGGDGTRAKPFATIAEAVASAKKSGTRRVYACAQTFAEAVELPAETTLYGGLDCAKSWAFSTKGRTTLAPASGVPITFDAGAAIHVENVHATAPDGAPADDSGANPRSGGSSIAAVALPSSDVELVRCELLAGKGADGKAADADPPAAAAPDGKGGAAACTTGAGGVVVANDCPDPSAPGGKSDTSGGRGGDGEGAASAMPPAPGSGASGGAEGISQTSSVLACSEGGPGGAGADGAAGQGGQSQITLLDDRFKGAPGADGKQGVSGGGGGGGGSGKACSAAPGAGGGSGGAGGCGGAGGRGGGAGGSSIALWAVDASISLTDVALVAGVAGNGAPGAAGQDGATGGAGGPPGATAMGEDSASCRGGGGGQGGNGGPGGGGQGGHSIAAVWKSVPPKATGGVFTAGVAGQGAAGGQGAKPASTGANGLACQGLDVAKGECVSP